MNTSFISCVNLGSRGTWLRFCPFDANDCKCSLNFSVLDSWLSLILTSCLRDVNRLDFLTLCNKPPSGSDAQLA